MSKEPMGPPPDRRNVQGLILRGYTHPFSCHMLFSFPDMARAAAFLRALMPYVQNAEDWGSNKPLRMLNIGFTCEALRLFLGDLVDQFPSEFRAGPWSPDSQLSLQDSGPSAPSLWWNGYGNGKIHCIIHTYALTAEALQGLVDIVAQSAKTGGLKEILPLNSGTARLEEYAPLGTNVHFGYHDGIDNPDLDWPRYVEDTTPGDANNFVIGYKSVGFQTGPQIGEAGSFAKDGCYDAFRAFYQDVEAFDQFLTDTAPAVAGAIGGSADHAKEWLAAKLVGRWRNGSPLVLSPDAPDPATANATDFSYLQDSDGMRCPFSAHTRIANPRDEAVFASDSPVPRIARRGMAYGAPPVPPDYSGDRGLIGLFLCGSLANQFEKLCSWMNTNNFSDVFPNFDTQDAVVANRGTPNIDPSFTIPLPNGASPIVIPSLPQFLVTRGTAYFLLPSIASLQQLAAMA